MREVQRNSGPKVGRDKEEAATAMERDNPGLSWISVVRLMERRRMLNALGKPGKNLGPTTH